MNEQDPQHPIIESPHQYAILAYNYERNIEDWRDSHFDLTLRKGDVTRRLRFLSPTHIRIGDVENNGGMVILDVRRRQLDGINVEVANFENAAGTIELYARDVTDLDAPEITS